MNQIKERHPINNIKWGIIPITNYRGCLLEKMIGGYRILNTVVTTPQEVDRVIDNANKSIEKSIVNVTT